MSNEKPMCAKSWNRLLGDMASNSDCVGNLCTLGRLCGFAAILRDASHSIAEVDHLDDIGVGIRLLREVYLEHRLDSG